MPDVSFEDFDVDVLDTFGKPEDYLTPKEDKRLDGRTKQQAHDNIVRFNKEEDYHVANISQVHNAAHLGCEISVAGIGSRHEFYDNPADIPNEGDHRWFFHFSHNFELNFALNIELKARRFSGPQFRPKEYDVEVCIDRNIPYLLIQNSDLPEASIILQRMEDLVYIRNTYDSITHEIKYGEPWNPYQEDKSKPLHEWRRYYKCNVFDCPERFQNRKINYYDLKREGNYDAWIDVVGYFRSVHETINAKHI